MSLYTGHNVRAVHDLHYSWTGWPDSMPRRLAADALAALWQPDGLVLESDRWTAEDIHLTFRATPDIAPVFLAARAKGRLQHALRQAGTPVAFSRKVSVRAIGHNVTDTVNAYVHNQLCDSDLADPRYRDSLSRHAVQSPDVDLAEPSATNSGRYWYNLHVVLVTANRFRNGGDSFLGRLRDAALMAAEETGSRVKALALMPDHVHVALRGGVEKSPAEIAVALQNGTTGVAGCRMWQDGYYVGTFSEYDTGAIPMM